MSNNLFELDSITQILIRPNVAKQKILNKISFNIKEGEIIAILGKSGWMWEIYFT